MQNLSKQIHEPKVRPVKVLQFGEGNFLRAFCDWIIQEMNDRGVYNGAVAVVQPLAGGRVRELEAQDGLYTMYQEGVENGKVVKESKIIDVLQDFINPYTEYDKYLAYGRSEDLEVVLSNTTEAGIVLDSNDTNFDVTPSSFPGKLLALLKVRYDHFNGDMSRGLNIVPCELIDYNGEELKRIMNELAVIKGFDANFINWLNNANSYSSTLVDRIVPGFPGKEIDQVYAELGYIDHSVVKGEVFHLWVISKNPKLEAVFPADKCGLNVIFADDITPYKERKVKILNGAHTCLVPVSYLYGYDTVLETMNDAVLGKFVRDFMFDEVVPTIDLPEDQMVAFSNSIVERFQNPFTRHELLSIALNSNTKYKTRILPTILDFNAKFNRLPQKSLFALAALMVFFKGDRDGEMIPLKDDQKFLDLWKDLWSRHTAGTISTRELTSEFLGLVDHWEQDLNLIPTFTDSVTRYVDAILNDGMKVAVKLVA